MKSTIHNTLLFFCTIILLCCQAMAGDLHTDVVIIGAGASGTSAALAAESKGVNTVLIEKAPFPAGAGTFAGGMFAADSSQQKREHKTVSKEWVYNLYTERSNYYDNSRLLINIINNAGRTVDFLISKGGQFSLIDAGYGQLWNQGHPATLHGYQNGGGSVNIGRMQKTYKDQGGTLLFETKGLKIVKNSNGTVAGVLVENGDGEQYTIYAKAVIVATGGMAGNKALLQKLMDTDNPPVSPVTVAQGEGIQMALDAGAKSGHIVPQLYATDLLYKNEKGRNYMVWTLSYLPFLKVNEQGKRFMREDHSSEYHGIANALFVQPNHSAWAVFDQHQVDLIKNKGFISVVDVYSKWKNSKQEYYEFNEKDNTGEQAAMWESPFDLKPDIELGLAGGSMVKADTIEDLAKAMGVDPKTFSDEVARYNGFAKNGNDEDFHNVKSMMYPVKNGPFYAVHMTTRILCTLGGVTVDENLHAVDKNYKPIPGLYVVGNDATGMYGNSYLEIEGGTLGFAYTSGMLAGEDAAAFVK